MSPGRRGRCVARSAIELRLDSRYSISTSRHVRVVTVSLLLYGCENYEQLAAVEVGPQLQRDSPKQPPHASKYGQAFEADGLFETRVTARRQFVAIWLTIALAVVAMLMAKAAPSLAP